ncbi:MAG: hypothetical protein LBG61_01700 [Burkholderiales bacterium]|jgi:hypothetical protein|nr:hypothetical protein [Burkholderiales bacterium]
MKRRTKGGCPRLNLERGIVLIITLLVLVVLTFATVATFRQINTLNYSLAGYSFRATGNAATMFPIETIVSELTQSLNNPDEAVRSALEQSNPKEGYYAKQIDSSKEKGGIPEVLHSGRTEGVRTFKQDSVGNVAYAVVERLCSDDGAPTLATCVGAEASGSGNGSASGSTKQGSSTTNQFEKGRSPPSGSATTNNVQVAYRISVRVQGPRTSVSYAQAIVVI